MKQILKFWCVGGIAFYNLATIAPTYSQIIPDTTLPNSSTVTEQNSRATISGGTEAGTNLFHSFEQFSIPTGETAYFNNGANIKNIFSRITGASISNIDGLIEANGATSLFLLNPNGIIFGPNASLNLTGSFIGTTANSISFSDGTQFGKTDQTTPLLTVSVPVGLNLNSSSGDINVLGRGNNAVARNFIPIISNNTAATGLKVQPQQTLAIVGGNLSLEGAIVSASGGNVELGSINNGTVRLIPLSSGWSLNYEGVNSFKDVLLSQRSLVDASGLESGSIQVQANKIQISDSSLLLIQNQGFAPGGVLKVNASESIRIQDSGLPIGVNSGIWSETLGVGKGGNIEVSTPNLILKPSAQIYTATYGQASAGDIILTVPKVVQMTGTFPNELGNDILVGSFAIGNGRSGNITLSVGQLNISNGSILITSNLASNPFDSVVGGSGNITINATDLIEVEGTTSSNSLTPSAISAATFTNGQAGNVLLNTKTLRVLNGARVDSSTGSSGAAGNVTVNASELVEVIGEVPDLLNPSLIISSANVVEPSLQQLLKIPRIPSGRSGNVIVNTNNLRVSKGGLVSVRNDGLGDAGNIEIKTRSIELDERGGISAATLVGEGGNIFLESQNLLLRNGSNISATADNRGNGGNLTINTDTLVALQDSDITANAFEGRGGNIQITTQGLFSSSDSEFNASSRFGVDGNIDIQTFGLDIRNSITPLQNRLVTTDQVIAGSCLARPNVERGSFVITGTGGLPINPYSGIERWDNLTRVQPVEDEKAQSQELSVPPANNNANQSLPRKWQPGDPIVEAQALILKADGRASLIASSPQPEISNADSLVCQPDQAKS